MIELIILIAGMLLIGYLMTYVARQSKGLNTAYYKENWNQIEQTYSIGESGRRLAVIDADKLVDQALKQSNVHGDTMGDRLKQASYLKNINNLWTAHKLRNKLVHEPNVKPKKSETRSALNAFHKSLKELGAL